MPQRAVHHGAKGHFVWVVNKADKAELRPVEVGDWLDERWFIAQAGAARDAALQSYRLSIQNAFAAVRTQLVASAGNVYKAMGGGWVDIADRVTGSAIPPARVADPPVPLF